MLIVSICVNEQNHIEISYIDAKTIPVYIIYIQNLLVHWRTCLKVPIKERNNGIKICTHLDVPPNENITRCTTHTNLFSFSSRRLNRKKGHLNNVNQLLFYNFLLYNFRSQKLMFDLTFLSKGAWKQSILKLWLHTKHLGWIFIKIQKHCFVNFHPNRYWKLRQVL